MFISNSIINNNVKNKKYKEIKKRVIKTHDSANSKLRREEKPYTQ